MPKIKEPRTIIFTLQISSVLAAKREAKEIKKVLTDYGYAVQQIQENVV